MEQQDKRTEDDPVLAGLTVGRRRDHSLAFPVKFGFHVGDIIDTYLARAQ